MKYLLLTRIFLIVLLTTLMVSCSKETAEDITYDFESPHLSGFFFRDETGYFLGYTGIPNMKLWSEGISLSSYPNPCKNSLRITIAGSQKNAVKTAWFVRGKTTAEIQNSFTDLNVNLADFNGSPILKNQFTGNSYTLNISGISSGYYRAYVSVENKLLYDNLIISNQ